MIHFSNYSSKIPKQGNFGPKISFSVLYETLKVGKFEGADFKQDN